MACSMTDTVTVVPHTCFMFLPTVFEEKRGGSQSMVKHSTCNLLNLLRKTRVLWISFHRVDMQSVQSGGSLGIFFLIDV